MRDKIIAQAIAALLTVSFAPTASAEDNHEHTMGNIPGMEKCHGIAKAGMNDCSTAQHTCAGANKQDGDQTEWLLLPNGLCNKIVGGSTKPTHK